MEKLKTSLAAKAAAVLLTLIIGAGGFWTTVFTISQWDTLWLGSSYYDSNDCYDDLMNREVQLHELARLLQAGSGRAPCPTWISAGWKTWRRPCRQSRPTSASTSAATTRVS